MNLSFCFQYRRALKFYLVKSNIFLFHWTTGTWFFFPSLRQRSSKNNLEFYMGRKIYKDFHSAFLILLQRILIWAFQYSKTAHMLKSLTTLVMIQGDLGRPIKLEQPFSSTYFSYMVRLEKFITEEGCKPEWTRHYLRVPFDPCDCLSTSSSETKQLVSSTVSQSLANQDE